MQTSRVATLPRGAGAALLAFALALRLGAQGVGAVQTRERDSLNARMAAPTRAVIDSIAILMRALNNESPGSTASATLRRQIDALLPGSRVFVVRKASALPRGWVGFIAQGPKHEMVQEAGDFIQYFAYPSIVAVDPESPAQRAGIAPGDMLIAYNGLDVRGREFNLTRLLEPDRKLSVTIRRDGETKDFAMIVAKAPERIFQRRMEFGAMPDASMEFERIRRDEGPRGLSMQGIPLLPGMPSDIGMYLPRRAFIMSPSGAFGAVLSNVSPDLAKTLKLAAGVLVNDVASNTLASEAGLRTGDVIVTAAGQPVGSIYTLHELISKHLADQFITLQVMRDRRRRQVSVNW